MAALIAPAIAAGASLIGNIFNKSSTNSSNRTNLKIAQMNNEWSERMMQKQMDYNTQMWNAQNDYNDPSKQVERFKAAGINPALALGNISTGTAQGGNSVGMPSPSHVSVQPNRYDFSGIGNALMSAISINNLNKVQESQARFTNMQADYYGAKTMAEISKIMAETHSHTAKTYYQNLLNKYGDNMLGAEYINKIRQSQALEVQILNTIKQGVLMDKQIARYDEQTNAQIADLVATTALKYAQGNMSKQELKNAIETNKSIKLSNKEKDAIFDFVVKKAELDTWRFGASELPALGAYGLGQGLKKIGSWLGFGK